MIRVEIATVIDRPIDEVSYAPSQTRQPTLDGCQNLDPIHQKCNFRHRKDPWAWGTDLYDDRGWMGNAPREVVEFSAPPELRSGRLLWDGWGVRGWEAGGRRTSRAIHRLATGSASRVGRGAVSFRNV